MYSPPNSGPVNEASTAVGVEDAVAGTVPDIKKLTYRTIGTVQVPFKYRSGTVQVPFNYRSSTVAVPFKYCSSTVAVTVSCIAHCRRRAAFVHGRRKRRWGHGLIKHEVKS